MKKSAQLVLCLIGVASFSAVQASDARYFTCVGEVNDHRFGYEYELQKYTNESGQLSIRDELLTQDLKINLFVYRNPTTGTRQSRFEILEQRGFFTDSDICAGGGCSVGSPKYRSVLFGQGLWEDEAIPEIKGQSQEMMFHCSTYEKTREYKRLKKAYDVEAR